MPVIEQHFPSSYHISFNIDVVDLTGVAPGLFYRDLIVEGASYRPIAFIQEREVVIELDVVIRSWGSLSGAWRRASMISGDSDEGYFSEDFREREMKDFVHLFGEHGNLIHCSYRGFPGVSWEDTVSIYYISEVAHDQLIEDIVIEMICPDIYNSVSHTS